MTLPSHDYGRRIAADTVRIERLLPGPIERVWAYLTEADKRRLWLASGEMALYPGGAVELIFDHAQLSDNDDPVPEKHRAYSGETRNHGRITAIDPPYLLSYTWSEHRELPSEVCFQLSSEGAQVRLVVTHRRLVGRDEFISVASGWHTHLDILIARLSGHAPDGFWRAHTRLEAEYEARLPLD